jgi:hypothetical protein
MIRFNAREPPPCRNRSPTGHIAHRRRTVALHVIVRPRPFFAITALFVRLIGVRVSGLQQSRDSPVAHQGPEEALVSRPTRAAGLDQIVTRTTPNVGGCVSHVKCSDPSRVSRLIPTRVKADSFRGFQTGASQIPWRRTGGSPCGQELHFARTMTRPSFGP